jgi:hypothetical protein
MPTIQSKVDFCEQIGRSRYESYNITVVTRVSEKQESPIYGGKVVVFSGSRPNEIFLDDPTINIPPMHVCFQFAQQP